MTRKEIIQNLLTYLCGSKKVDSLVLKNGAVFQTGCIIYTDEDGIDGTLEACDDEHPDGLLFTIDDIEELKIC